MDNNVKTTGKNASRMLAQHASNLRFEDLPPKLVNLTKRCILDTLGVSIGASGLAHEGHIACEYVRELGGKPESTLLGFGGKVPAAMAAFVNGGLGHMLDYDDVAAGHPSIATIPVAFALAEKNGGISGRDLITAIACGTDIMMRIDTAISIPEWTSTEGWFATQLLGFISGAATAGKVLKLNEDQMENALGIGFNQISGTRQMAVGASTHMRSMQAGFSGQGAVMSALLAQKGMIGSKDFIEGQYGFFKTYVRTPSPDWEALIGGLGKYFPLLDHHAFKVWPACNFTRPTNTAILKLRKDYQLQPEEIESITIIGGHANTQQLSEPIERKRRPKIAIDGKFSIPFTSAVMMVNGNVTLKDYTDEGLNDPKVLAMADRVSYRSVLGHEKRMTFPSVEIRTKDGRILHCQPEKLLGNADNPIDEELLNVKFRDCVSFSHKPISIANRDRAMSLIEDLENVIDAVEIIQLLSPA